MALILFSLNYFIYYFAASRAIQFHFHMVCCIATHMLWLALSITNFLVKDFLILRGPCPNCGTQNVSFFGTILSISNGGSADTVKCSK
ncbi:hypothetical protein ACSBR1_029550 [Camellia fascicularis]